MIDNNPIGYESEYNKAINELVKLRQKYDVLEEDRDYLKSLLDVEFEEKTKLQKENEQLKQQLKIYKKDGPQTLNDLQKVYENNRKVIICGEELSNLLNELSEENERLKKEILWRKYLCGESFEKDKNCYNCKNRETYDEGEG